MVTKGQKYVVEVDWEGYIPGTIVVIVEEIKSGGGYGQDYVEVVVEEVKLEPNGLFDFRKKLYEKQELDLEPNMLQPLPPQDPTTT